jgi:hypothetical protein
MGIESGEKMNTNTIEQAERLKELGVEHRIVFEPVLVGNGFKIIDWHRDPNDHQNWKIDKIAGPALTLDELHQIFLYVVREWPEPGIEFGGGETWDLNSPELVAFDRTKNHAEDWTTILIWLLEEKHVTAEQTNGTLG